MHCLTSRLIVYVRPIMSFVGYLPSVWSVRETKVTRWEHGTCIIFFFIYFVFDHLKQDDIYIYIQWECSERFLTDKNGRRHGRMFVCLVIAFDLWASFCSSRDRRLSLSVVFTNRKIDHVYTSAYFIQQSYQITDDDYASVCFLLSWNWDEHSWSNHISKRKRHRSCFSFIEKQEERWR